MTKKVKINFKLKEVDFPSYPYILKIELDLNKFIGNLKYLDLSTLKVESSKERLVAQFSPDEEFNIEKNCLKGILSILVDKKIKEINISFLCGEKEEEVIKLPYPFYTYRIIEKNKFIKKPNYFYNFQIHPLYNERILFSYKRNEFAIYNYSKSQPKPFFEKLIGPSGKNVIRLGHPHDPFLTHTHHHGLWIGHANINGFNFWEEGENKNKIEHQNFLILEDGPVCGRFLELNYWRTKEGKIILKEKREIYIFNLGEYLILDFILRFYNDEEDIKIGKTPFGFLAVRVAKHMSVFDGGGIIINSEGMINEKEIFWKRAKWCDYSGPISEKGWNGITIFDNKENPNYPTYWHCRSDGWFCPSFTCNDEYILEKNKVLNLKYRIFIHKEKGEIKSLGKHFNFYNSFEEKII